MILYFWKKISKTSNASLFFDFLIGKNNKNFKYWGGGRGCYTPDTPPPVAPPLHLYIQPEVFSSKSWKEHTTQVNRSGSYTAVKGLKTVTLR
jgi:hypothetical protein